MKTLLLITSAIFFIGSSLLTQTSKNVKYDAQSKSISIPEVKGSHIIPDGIFSENEWNGAVNFPISENFEIYLLADSGNLYAGFKYLGKTANAVEALDCVSEIYIAWNDKEFYNLHSSASICEGINLFSEDLKRAKFAAKNAIGWEANFGSGFQNKDLKCNGKEYKINLNKFTSRSIKFAGGLMAVNTTIRESANFPANSNFKNPDNWVELILPGNK